MSTNVEIPGTLLLDPDVLEDPYPFYDRLRRDAPIWRVGGTDVFAATSFQVVAEIVGRTGDFSNNVPNILYRDSQGLPRQLPLRDLEFQALASADPPVHTVHRRTVFPELVARRMSGLAPEIEKLSRSLIRGFVQAGGGDFMQKVANQIPISVIGRLIGFRDSNPKRLIRAAFDSTLMIGASNTLEDLQTLVEHSEDIQTWITEEIKGGGAPDVLLGTIAQGIDDGAIAMEEGAIILHTLLSAGGESTTSLIGNSVRILAERAELQSQIRDQPTLIPNFVEEVLRLESPFRMQMRSVPADTNVNGVDVHAGATVLVFFSAANRDPSEFDDAATLRLDRDSPRYHVAFGRGIHHCVGAPLARLEASVVLSELLAATKSIRLDPRASPRWVRSLLVRRHEILPLLVGG